MKSQQTAEHEVTEDGVVLCANGISEKFRRIGNRYNIKTAFKTSKSEEFALQNNATKPNSSPRTA
jgi:hypothetical protein